MRSVSIVLFKGEPFTKDEVNDSSLGQIKREANQAHPKDYFDQAIGFNGANIQSPFDIQQVNQQFINHNLSNNIRFAATYADHVITSPVKCALAKHSDYQDKEIVFVINTQVHKTAELVMFSFEISLD